MRKRSLKMPISTIKSLEVLRPIIQTMRHHLILESMIAGLTKGAVYVDEPTQPGAALFQYKHRLFLSGEPNPTFANDLKTLFRETIFPQAKIEGYAASVLYFDSEKWQPIIEKIADGKRSYTGRRRYFRRRPSANPSQPPENISIRPINADLIGQTHLENIDLLIEEIQSERGSVDDFLKLSFGVCALAGDVITGLCTSEYNTGSRCEVGIMTMDAYQRRGIATAMAHAFAAEAASHGIAEIGWHCWANNEPSAATALKAGFEPVLDYPALEIWHADNL